MKMSWRVLLLIVLLGGARSSLSALEGQTPKPDVVPPLEKVEPPTRDTPDNNGPTTPSRVLPGEAPTHKNYWLPALEIPAFIAVWNRFDRLALSGHDYDSTWASGWD